MDNIITIITCSLLLIINFVSCQIDYKNMKQLRKRIKALEDKQHD